MVLDVINSSVLKIIEPYRKWIIENPQLLCEIENMVHCLPYFTAGHFNNSTFVSELLYSTSNLIVLFNDLLMCNEKCVNLKFSQFETKIKIWLTVVEYTEALVEISAKKLWGQTGKWFMIVVVQLFNCQYLKTNRLQNRIETHVDSYLQGTAAIAQQIAQQVLAKEKLQNQMYLWYGASIFQILKDF
ncbi:Peroxisomal membrane protein PEX16 [Melipona quadrifasciata]|uniref:Peroxisomal membrane protein PEX16 n=1 Tax=Melipona quadrifasciata TaxID=166423 RepID=A0A0N0BEK0_9HYME|nr:Peroxisomal membrane protein PEX16 [Melipona quadrifasciata]